LVKVQQIHQIQASFVYGFYIQVENGKWWEIGLRCQGHKYPQEQRLKESSKSNFQTRNKTSLCDSKNKNTRTENKNKRCVKHMWKQIFIMLTCVNMNTKRTWQGYDARSCLRRLLNKLKEMRGPTPIYTLLGTYLKEVFKEASMCASSKEASW
jgi:hypothetical protein